MYFQHTITTFSLLSMAAVVSSQDTASFTTYQLTSENLTNTTAVTTTRTKATASDAREFCQRLCGRLTGGGWIANYEACGIGQYKEDVMKYYGVCYDTSPDLDGDDYVSLDDAYKSDAWRYLAYYTLTKSPKFCAGTGTAPGSSDIMSAVSDAFWYTSLVPSTVHDIMTGIQYWIDHPGNKANIAHSAGMKWSSLDYMYGDYSENQAGTIFYQEKREALCNTDPGPQFKAVNSAGYAPGKCSTKVNIWYKPQKGMTIPMTVLLNDQNGMSIGWAIQQEGKDEAISIFSKLPDFSTVLMTNWQKDVVTFAYDSQNITLSCGPYSGTGDDKKRVCSGNFTCK